MVKKELLTISVLSAALLASSAFAQSPGFSYTRRGEVVETERRAPPPPQSGPTALQLANPNYHPPAKRLLAMDGYLNLVKPQGETPRMADGKPDLTGIWSMLPVMPPAGPGGARGVDTGEPDQTVIQRAGGYVKPIYKPEYWEKVRSLDFSTVTTDPVFLCHPHGVPRDATRPTIIMNTKQIWLQHKYTRTRVAPIDNLPRNPDDEDQTTTMGIPIGHWDGDTLVLESTGFTDETWFNWTGYFHSDRMTLSERLTRKGNLIYYQYTLTDPKVLAEPYTSFTSVWRLDPDPNAVPMEPLICETSGLQDGIVDQYFRG